jgi:asparagine synthase (glutamine-hydrolysing)
MSGIFTVADARRRTSIAAALERMGTRLVHRPWYVCERWVDGDEAVGLGRVAGGVFNREPQPASSADGAVTAVCSGMVWCADERDTPAGMAHDAAAQLAIRAYRQFGLRFAERLAGEFVIALWDRDAQALIVSSDRFGSYPTYYASVDGVLLVAPEMRALFTWPSLRKRPDTTAMAEYMRFQCVLGTRTFFEGISRVPPASVMRFDLRTETLAIERYWNLSAIPARRDVRFAEAVEETTRLLDAALRRSLDQSRRPGLYLTGGLDSRLLLSLIPAAHPGLTTFTFGQPNARDVAYAKRLARTAGTTHHWLPFVNGEWVKAHADFHLDLSEGFQSWIHMHGVSTLAAVRELADVTLTGLGGGTVVGGWLNKFEPFAEVDDPRLLAAELFGFFNQVHTWPGLSEAEERALYEPRLWDQVRGRAFDSLVSEAERAMDCRPDLRAEYLYLRNHEFGFGNYRVVVARSHVEMPSPYFDHALVTFIYSLPARLRGYKALERAMLQRCAPRLCLVPYAGTGFLPTTHRLVRSSHMWATKLRRKVNTHIAPLFPEPVFHYADYEHYARTDLREWCEDLLLGPRTRARGLFNPPFLESLWRRLQAGREPDMIGKLAPLMTYEHILRRFVDE